MIKSHYFLRITSRYCKHEIRVNDLYCLNNYKGNQTGSEIPINDFLLNGKNSIIIKLEPASVQDIDRDIIFMVNAIIEERSIKDDSVIREILNLNREVNILQMPSKLHELFTIDEPFINPDYLESRVIELSKETMALLFAFYKNIYNLMEKKDITSLIELFAKKESAFALSYNLKPEDRINYIETSFSDYLNEPDSELLDLDLQFLNFELYSNAKLICLQEKINKRPALGIYSELNKITTYFPIYLSINRKGIQIAR